MCQNQNCNCKKPYYITTAIAYTSGKPHIGNTYEAVLADSIARFKRAEGYDVRFQTGTDEHGQKIELKAEAAGVSPQDFVDGVAGEIKTIWDLMNTSYDKFIRTTDKDHEAQVQKIFKKLYDQGDIYKGYYEGLYCTPCESFFTESQLVDGKCPDCGREVKPAKEEAYFFRMSKYADRLIQYINEHPDFIQPESRKNEMMNNFLLPGLQDLCVSRTSFTWGIPVDFDPKHVTYVWLDALTNYITGLGYDCDGESGELFKKYDGFASKHVVDLFVEYAKKGNKLVGIIRVTAETLSGIPSIIYGLFGMLFFVTALKWGYSMMAGAATLAIMVLPVIMRTTEEALLCVPDSFREGSFGLGAGKLRTIFKIVLPSAIPGILSGIILAIGRIVGETAALIYTSGTVANLAGFFDSGRTLAIHMYSLSREGMHTNEAYATAVVLLVVVLIINGVSSLIAKKFEAPKQ